MEKRQHSHHPHAPVVFDDVTTIVPHSTPISHFSSLEQYQKEYQKSINNPSEYWGEYARSAITWNTPFTTVTEGSFAESNVKWFIGGKLNVAYNCVDRHLEKRANQTAIMWEQDEPNQTVNITYQTLYHEVCKLSNGLRSLGVKKGDRVIIYMPMVPEAVYAMLSTVRIGAIHSVVFAGFSADALKQRIIDTKANIIITANVGLRGKRLTMLKELVDEALNDDECSCIQHVIVHRHIHYPNHPISMKSNRDLYYSDLTLNMNDQISEPEIMDSEDALFMLYTSGSTGKPKGLIHTTAGYLTYAAHTTKYLWDLLEGDRFGCVADVGWITGHTYIVYGPLVNGSTTLLFEGTPLYPDAGRYWQIVQSLQLTQFYTAPTAIRTLMSFGNEYVCKWDRSSLRTIGSVGEPINPEAWKWYYEVVGEKRSNVIDTWFQTETGAIMISPISPITPTKPGSATLPYFGIIPVVLDTQTGKEIKEIECEGLLAISQPWPSIARTIYGCHERYVAGYFSHYPGYFFTGDGCKRDKDGYIWVTGRVDDVINKSGHRLGTAEIESALILSPCCAESAVVAIPDDIRGSAIVAFCVLRNSFSNPADEPLHVTNLKKQVRKSIGGIAVPDILIIVPGLPKTRSGKIMRRILRKIACDEADQIGDVSTLADPSIIPIIIDKYNETFQSPPMQTP